MAYVIFFFILRPFLLSPDLYIQWITSYSLLYAIIVLSVRLYYSTSYCIPYHSGNYSKTFIFPLPGTVEGFGNSEEWSVVGR